MNTSKVYTRSEAVEILSREFPELSRYALLWYTAKIDRKYLRKTKKVILIDAAGLDDVRNLILENSIKVKEARRDRRR